MKLLCPPLLNRVHCMDALELLRLIPAQSVNAIITDLPYGTTSCHWDEIIPFEPMWAGVKRVLKPRGVFVTTASQPFTSKLVMSNLAWFKYEWVWDKVHKGNIFLASYQPLKTHENVVVFSHDTHSYYPQMTKGVMRTKGGGVSKIWDAQMSVSVNDDYFPTSIVKFSSGDHTDVFHPTQKPVALYEYLIRTYTQPGNLVLDFCCGSGTTAVAARNLKRNYIVGDTDAGYCESARERLKTEFASRKLGGDADLSELPLFRGDDLYRPAGKAAS